jgi:predicted Rossmann-fold nucleotide-binding protein
MGEARNALVVRAAESLIAVGGEWGTLSEIALAKKTGKAVVVLGRPPADGLGLPTAESAEEAVQWALTRAEECRGQSP